ncbi:ubiquitin-conjugating enzyme E2-binding protein [Lasiosphaeria miniovina]|uniref:Ubiquitin-conjugating enzyme E2-binding protein n=1 Tax=Lasiosphaeria miniovina TaxID=1954250 RepID=A0AA40AJK1_9PEZI|nr:ubiquitin-conjugating enzyme E2-binding protein [Lasiosphaeria miniovina]KAK0716967.1 ubiquitin-conjugating enzyme E2-binding protein [Lasiosphaeria miniovina]
MASCGSIYAELLSNIRQISLAVSLHSPSDASTQVAVTADGCSVELRHRGETRHLVLPAKVTLGGAVLPIQKQNVQSLSWRLPLDPEGSSPGLVFRPRDGGEQRPPSWSAADLLPGSEVSCRQCGSVLVNKDALTVWKDLPSENWAEMMEFWHCHKPSDGGHHHAESNGQTDEKSIASKGYGASSHISAQKSIGFVDLTTLLFAEDDCLGITFSPSGYEHGSADRHALAETDAPGSQPRSLNVFCSSCRTQLGFFNFRAAAVTLLKWQISCQSVSGSAPGISKCLAVTLISIIARSASSKLLITPISESTTSPDDTQPSMENALHIWVLNSGIVYSSSATAPGSTPAIKLLYRLIRREEAERMLETLTYDAQEVSLPAGALGNVIQSLDESNGLLPESERLFKEWKVGLLKK